LTYRKTHKNCYCESRRRNKELTIYKLTRTWEGIGSWHLESLEGRVNAPKGGGRLKEE